VTRLNPDTRADYAYTLELSTRWNDNDVYGHMNNTVYYEYFDTVVNRWLIENGLLKLGESETITCKFILCLWWSEHRG
jgi:acyl-CoA thioester hydrolase